MSCLRSTNHKRGIGSGEESPHKKNGVSIFTVSTSKVLASSELTVHSGKWPFSSRFFNHDWPIETYWNILKLMMFHRFHSPLFLFNQRPFRHQNPTGHRAPGTTPGQCHCKESFSAERKMRCNLSPSYARRWWSVIHRWIHHRCKSSAIDLDVFRCI